MQMNLLKGKKDEKASFDSDSFQQPEALKMSLLLNLDLGPFLYKFVLVL